MKADPTLISDIRRTVGNTRSDRIKFVGACNALATDIGDAIKHNEGRQALKTLFDKAMLGFPRAVTACVIASTISMRDGMSMAAMTWAQDVLDAWKPTSSQRLMAVIDDNLHPGRIEEYAGAFIRLTSVGRRWNG